MTTTVRTGCKTFFYNTRKSVNFIIDNKNGNFYDSVNVYFRCSMQYNSQGHDIKHELCIFCFKQTFIIYNCFL